MILLAGFFQRFFQARAGVLQVLGGRFAGEKFIDRLAQRAVPVLIETVPELLGHRPHAEHVDVGEIQVRLGIEILVAQIAPADDGRAVVRQPQFVMHAPVLQRQVEQAPGRAGDAGTATQMQRVEQANLDLRMRRQRGDDLVETIAGGVVEQDAYAHATVGSLEQFLDEHSRADAVVDDVVLQIEADLRVADQLGAGSERFGAVGQQAEAGAAFIRRGLSLNRTAKRRAAGRQGLAGLALHIDTGAAGERQHEDQKQERAGSQVGSFRV